MPLVADLHRSGLYKAVSPRETVHRVRTLLHAHDIFTIEQFWHVNEGFTSSVSVAIDGLPLSTNGKGINNEYALASAYGEMMERLQNLILVNGRLPFPIGGSSDSGLLDYPDHVPFDPAQLRKQAPVVYEAVFEQEDRSETDRLLGDIGRIHSVPFYHVNSGKVTPLPWQVLACVLSSNGMCAGNSPEEALIHGLCEVFERYIHRKVFYDNIAWPVIPSDFLKPFPQWAYLARLKEHGFEVSAIDCSLAGRFPAVGLYVRMGEQAAFRIGCAPHFLIALERCVTEMLQGSHLDALASRLLPVPSSAEDALARRFSSNRKRQLYRFLRALTLAPGLASPMALHDGGAFDRSHLFRCEDASGREALRRLVDLVVKSGHHLYIRDVSFMGFPAYLVYVPGMSEILKADSALLRMLFVDSPKARETFLGMGRSSREDVIHLIGTMKQHLDTPVWVDLTHVLPALHRLPLNSKASVNRFDPEVLIALLSHEIGDVQGACDALRSYVRRTLPPKESGDPPPGAQRHVCLLKVLEGMAQGRSLAEAGEAVREDFPASVRSDVRMILMNMVTLADTLDVPQCPRCEGCAQKALCYRPEIESLARKLEMLMGRYHFDQAKIGEHLS